MLKGYLVFGGMFFVVVFLGFFVNECFVDLFVVLVCGSLDYV